MPSYGQQRVESRCPGRSPATSACSSDQSGQFWTLDLSGRLLTLTADCGVASPVGVRPRRDHYQGELTPSADHVTRLSDSIGPTGVEHFDSETNGWNFLTPRNYAILEMEHFVTINFSLIR